MSSVGAKYSISSVKSHFKIMDWVLLRFEKACSYLGRIFALTHRVLSYLEASGISLGGAKANGDHLVVASLFPSFVFPCILDCPFFVFCTRTLSLVPTTAVLGVALYSLFGEELPTNHFCHHCLWIFSVHVRSGMISAQIIWLSPFICSEIQWYSSLCIWH